MWTATKAWNWLSDPRFAMRVLVVLVASCLVLMPFIAVNSRVPGEPNESEPILWALYGTAVAIVSVLGAQQDEAYRAACLWILMAGATSNLALVALSENSLDSSLLVALATTLGGLLGIVLTHLMRAHRP